MRIFLPIIFLAFALSHNLPAMYLTKPTLELEEQLKDFAQFWVFGSMQDIWMSYQQSLKESHIAELDSIIRELVEEGANPHKVGHFSVIHFAALSDNVGLLREVIEQHNVPVDTVDNRARTPLGYAARFDALEAARTLISLGANVNHVEAGHGNNTCLMFANPEIIRELVANNANIEAQNSNGDTPLIIAISRKAHLCTQTLIKLGADIEKRSVNEGSTPLMFAAQTGDKKALLMLLTSGADTTAVNNLGKTVRDYAVRSRIKRVVDGLPNSKTPYSNVLALAIEQQNAGLVFAYLKDVAHAGESVLATSIRLKATGLLLIVVNVLARENRLESEFNNKGLLGVSPLYFAVMTRNANAVDVLLANGAKPLNEDNAIALAHRIMDPTDNSPSSIFKKLHNNVAFDYFLILYPLDILPHDIKYLIASLAVALSLDRTN